MFGILNLFKPSGPTSRDCVNRIQRLIRPTKIGHAGTLDPLAEGVLLIVIGQAVRLVDWIHRLPKSYRGSFEFGKTSLSADTETEVTLLADPPIISESALQAILPEFIGQITQIPPIYSAVRVAGKRAHQRARAGDTFEVAARQVNIDALRAVEYAYPQLVLDIRCSTGTYIRSLGRDLARRLGSDAIMTKLTRTAIGDFTADQSVTLDELDSLSAIKERMVNPARCLTQYPSIILDDPTIRLVHQGKNIDGGERSEKAVRGRSEFLIGLDHSGKLRSILVPHDRQQWRPFRNFTDIEE